MAPSVMQYCVVCGTGSTRTDWISKQDGFVACDRHSKVEVTQAIKDYKAKQVADAEAVAEAEDAKHKVPKPKASAAPEPPAETGAKSVS